MLLLLRKRAELVFIVGGGKSVDITFVLIKRYALLRRIFRSAIWMRPFAFAERLCQECVISREPRLAARCRQHL